MQQGYQQQYPPQNFNQMPYQQNSGYQQPFGSQQYPQHYDNTTNYSSGNTGNYYNPNFGSPFNFQGNPNPNNPNYPNNPNFNNNLNYSNQGQGFMGNQGGVGQNVVNPNLNPNFNPFELLKRIWFMLVYWYHINNLCWAKSQSTHCEPLSPKFPQPTLPPLQSHRKWVLKLQARSWKSRKKVQLACNKLKILAQYNICTSMTTWVSTVSWI